MHSYIVSDPYCLLYYMARFFSAWYIGCWTAWWKAMSSLGSGCSPHLSCCWSSWSRWLQRLFSSNSSFPNPRFLFRPLPLIPCMYMYCHSILLVSGFHCIFVLHYSLLQWSSLSNVDRLTCSPGMGSCRQLPSCLSTGFHARTVYRMCTCLQVGSCRHTPVHRISHTRTGSLSTLERQGKRVVDCGAQICSEDRKLE